MGPQRINAGPNHIDGDDEAYLFQSVNAFVSLSRNLQRLRHGLDKMSNMDDDDAEALLSITEQLHLSLNHSISAANTALHSGTLLFDSVANDLLFRGGAMSKFLFEWHGVEMKHST